VIRTCLRKLNRGRIVLRSTICRKGNIRGRRQEVNQEPGCAAEKWSIVHLRSSLVASIEPTISMTDPEQVSSEKGRAAARQDIAGKRLRLFSGAPSEAPWGLYLAETLRQRFSIEVVFTSCLTTAEKRAFEDGYNAEVITHIDRAFGSGAYSLACEEVQRWRKARSDEWLAVDRPGGGA